MSPIPYSNRVHSANEVQLSKGETLKRKAEDDGDNSPKKPMMRFKFE